MDLGDVSALSRHREKIDRTPEVPKKAESGTASRRSVTLWLIPAEYIGTPALASAFAPCTIVLAPERMQARCPAGPHLLRTSAASVDGATANCGLAAGRALGNCPYAPEGCHRGPPPWRRCGATSGGAFRGAGMPQFRAIVLAAGDDGTRWAFLPCFPQLFSGVRPPACTDAS